MTFSEIVAKVDSFAWGPIMLILLVGTGVYYSCRMGFIQFSKFGYAMKNTLGKKLVSKESWLCGRCRLNATKYAGSLLGFASIGTASVAIAISGSSDDKKDGDALE